MIDVDIIEARDVDGAVVAYGQVDGHGYRVTVPAEEWTQARDKGAQQALLATAIKAQHERQMGLPLDVTGKVTV